MKYRIKNEDVEKAVRGLFKTQEAYEVALNNSYQIKAPYTEDRLICVHGHVSVTGSYCDVHVAVSNIEEVVEYDPKKWNPYPQVKPPKEGWYRAVDDVWRGALFWDGVEWKYLGGDIYLADDLMKFKPWDDDEGK